MGNSENHSVHTGQSTNLYLSQTNLTTDEKGVYYSGIKIFNNLPTKIKNFENHCGFHLHWSSEDGTQSGF
jgi:hypothetical protein